MQYLISFLEGIITFISPCLLPMLPIYVSYFAGGGERSTRKTLTNALGFILGFTVVFVAMGALAGTVGSFLKSHQGAVNIVMGLIVVFFGLNFLGVFHINLFHGSKRLHQTEEMGFLSAMVFGLIFSLGWTPCVARFWARRWRWPPSRGMCSWECRCCWSTPWDLACRSSSALCSSTSSSPPLTG